MADKDKPRTLASIFNRDTEQDQIEIEKAQEENRKRKLLTSPNNQKPETTGATSSSNSGVVTVSSRQRGNPLLSHIRNVVVTYSGEITPDYIMGTNICALFLSLKYHRLHPEYIYDRIKDLGDGFTVRVLLVLVDIPDSAVTLQEISKVALLSRLSLLLAWSNMEAARYIESFKIYENKPADVLQGAKDETQDGYSNRVLATVRGVNKRDVSRLLTECGTMKGVFNADKGKLSSLPGIGEKKAQRIYNQMRKPFRLK